MPNDDKITKYLNRHIIKMKKLFLLILLVLSFNVFSSNYIKGSITKLDGTNQSGYINFDYGNTLEFKTTLDGKKQTFNANELNGFQTDSSNYVVLTNISYTSQFTVGRINKNRAITKVLTSGKLKLFCYYGKNRDNIRYEVYLLMDKDGNIIHLKNGEKKFRKIITPIIADYPELVEKINSEKLSTKYVEIIVSEYNQKFN